MAGFEIPKAKVASAPKEIQLSTSIQEAVAELKVKFEAIDRETKPQYRDAAIANETRILKKRTDDLRKRLVNPADLALKSKLEAFSKALGSNPKLLEKMVTDKSLQMKHGEALESALFQNMIMPKVEKGMDAIAAFLAVAQKANRGF